MCVILYELTKKIPNKTMMELLSEIKRQSCLYICVCIRFLFFFGVFVTHSHKANNISKQDSKKKQKKKQNDKMQLKCLFRSDI